MRLLKYLLIATAAVLCLVAVAMLILVNIDLGRFKNGVEVYASRFAGREVVIDGELHISVGRSVSIQADDLRLGNADWSSTQDMLEVGRLELRIDLRSMVDRPVLIEHLRLERTRVLVEAHTNGDINWIADSAQDLLQPFAAIPIGDYVVEQAEIEDFSLRYGDGWLATARTVTIARGMLAEEVDGRLLLNLEGALDDLQISGVGHLGPLSNLLQGKNAQFDLAAEVGEFAFVANGQLEGVSPLQRPELAFQLTGPDIAVLLEEVGLPAFTSGSVDLRGELDQQQAGVRVDVTGSVGEIQIDVHGTLDDVARMEGLELDFDAAGPDLTALVNTLDVDYLPGGPFRLSGQLDGARPPFVLRDFSATVGGVSATVSGTVGTDGIDLQLGAGGPDLQAFLANWKELAVPSAPFAIAGNLRRVVGTDTWDVQKGRASLANETEFDFGGSLDAVVALLDLDDTIAASGPEFADSALDLRVELRGPDISDVWPAAAGNELPYRARGRLRARNGALVIDELDAIVGNNSLAGAMQFAPGEPPRVSGDFYSDSFDLMPYVDNIRLVQADEPATGQADPRLIPDFVIPVRFLDVADMDIRLAAAEIEYGAYRVTDFATDIVAEERRLLLDSLRAGFRRGNVAARVVVDNTSDLPALSVELTARDVMWDEPYDDAGNELDRPLQNLDLNLSGIGRTLDAVLASLNGSMRVEEGAGLMQNEPLKKLLAAIVPSSAEEKDIPLDCYVAIFDISEGVATSQALAIQTDKLKIVSRGTVNLLTEELDFRFKIVKRNGIGVSGASVVSPFVAVTGTLSQPDFELASDTALIALLTEGWTMVFDALGDIARKDINVCEESIEKAEAGN